jgi:hypothetical protein
MSGGSRLRSWLGVAAAVLGLVLVGGAGQLLANAEQVAIAAPREVAVQSTALVCPAPIATAGAVVTRITGAIAVLPDLPPAASTSKSSASIGGRTLTAPGSAVGFTVALKPIPPVVAVATGDLAPGLAADQLTQGSTGLQRGLAAQNCGAAVTDAWFVGGGSEVGRNTQLFLTNVDDETAQVDVLLFGKSGPLDSPGSLGIQVPGHARVDLQMLTLAPGQPVFGIHVIAREGRISPAVLDSQALGLQAQGIEYLQTTTLSRRTILPGILGGPGTRVLSVLAPNQDAQISLKVITVDGTIRPTTYTTINVPQGQLRQWNLASVLGQEIVGLELDSDQPIVAGVRSTLVGKFPDTAETAGTPVLSGPAVVAGLFAGQSSYLRLVAPGATATLTMVIRQNALTKPIRSSVIKVPGGTSITLAIPAPVAPSWFWVTLEPAPGSGPVYAGRQTSEAAIDGALVTSTPVLQLRPVAQIPAAVPEVGLG